MKKPAPMKDKPFRYSSLLWVLCAFLIIAAALFSERSGIHYAASSISHAYLESEEDLRAEQVLETLKKTCLLITNKQDAVSRAASAEWERILLDMKVGYTLADALTAEHYPFDDYETVVVALSNVSPMGVNLLQLTDWVRRGGSALFPLTLEQEVYSSLINPKIGILSSGQENVRVESYYPDEAFMLGGGRPYPITDPFESSRAVSLSEKAKVHVWSGDEKKLPLIWEQPYGEGKFVVVNMGNYEKNVRGFYASAYSLLTDCTIYPVINGAAFYLDDFPAPVHSGKSPYIQRDYGLPVNSFYSNIWWPDMLNLASKYHIKYTGALIENFGDQTDGTIVEPHDTQVFQHFGNMILHQQGEIAYHGYNHHPLYLENAPEHSPYSTWTDETAMKDAMTELISFADELFPSIEKSVYVPPSNMLSAEGRKMISEHFPEIRTIASRYLVFDSLYHQEFEVAEDGIIEQPRITSGCVVSDYAMLTAVSELNMHFVNSHYMRPDDLLDEYHGAEMGWAALKDSLEGYLNWLYTSAPPLTPLTASQLSGRIQRFAAAAAEKTVTEDGFHFKILNLYDSAYFMVRFNEGKPLSADGGTLEHLTGNLYLLHAESEDVRIRMDW